MPVTREFRVLLSDPEATKVLSFTHPPRGVHSIIVRSVTYPYYLPATGEAGELLVSCEIPGTPRALTCPHTLITDAGETFNYTSCCGFTNGFLFATFNYLWEHVPSLQIGYPAIMPHLYIDIRYKPTDGSARTFLPVIPNSFVTVELEVTADSW